MKDIIFILRAYSLGKRADRRYRHDQERQE